MNTPATSHAEALKSSSIIGGAAAITVLVRIVRTKFMAVFLGPAGVGLEAIYDSIVSLARTLFDCGVSSSGVRQIAASMATQDERQIAATVITLRRVCLFFGAFGAVALFAAREPVSQMAFDTKDHAPEIGFLSVILLLGAVAAGQGALLQGARRIGDLARIRILGTIAGAATSIPFVYFWGRDGIVPSMIVAAAVGGAISWIYARRIAIAPLRASWPLISTEAHKLLKLGLAFVATGLMSTGALFLIRAFVTHEEGVIGTGQFQAASALATIYIGFVLQAMGTDFYPRLTAIANNNRRCNQLVNEQTEVSILLGLPGILGTLAFAPWIVRLFYSDRFDQAAQILYWQLPGIFLQVNSWPIGFILLAKERALAFFLTDLAAYSVYVTLAWFGLRWYGLPGTGMAYLGLYLFHWVMIYFVARRVSGFRLSPECVRLSGFGLATLVLTLWARWKLPEPWSTITGALLAILAALYCLMILVRLVGSDKVTGWLRRFHFLGSSTSSSRP